VRKQADFSKYNGQWLEQQWKMICEKDVEKAVILETANYRTFRSIFFQAASKTFLMFRRQMFAHEGPDQAIFEEMLEYQRGVAPTKRPVRDECDKFIEKTLDGCPPVVKDISIRVFMTGAFAVLAVLMQAALDPSMTHATLDQRIDGMDERFRTLESELDAYFSGSLPGVQ
jgi:hypothetical protein